MSQRQPLLRRPLLGWSSSAPSPLRGATTCGSRPAAAADHAVLTPTDRPVRRCRPTRGAFPALAMRRSAPLDPGWSGSAPSSRANVTAASLIRLDWAV